MEDARGWFALADIRPIYRAAGADVRVVGWVQQRDGRQPMVECEAFDASRLRCSIYPGRPEHCRSYDCRDDDPDDWRARAHCDLARHQRLAARRPRPA